jgi:hypothetical protein
MHTRYIPLTVALAPYWDCPAFSSLPEELRQRLDREFNPICPQAWDALNTEERQAFAAQVDALHNQALWNIEAKIRKAKWLEAEGDATSGLERESNMRQAKALRDEVALLEQEAKQGYAVAGDAAVGDAVAGVAVAGVSVAGAGEVSDTVTVPRRTRRDALSVDINSALADLAKTGSSNPSTSEVMQVLRTYVDKEGSCIHFCDKEKRNYVLWGDENGTKQKLTTRMLADRLRRAKAR